jgi:hypothetical protein
MSQTTYHLTDSQKRSLEAQVAYANALMQQMRSKETWKTLVSTFFGHPAVITVIGSGFLALILASYQQHSALHDKQLEIAATLPAQLHRAGTILVDLQGTSHRLLTSNAPAANGSSKPPEANSPSGAGDLTAEVFKTILNAYVTQPEQITTLAEVNSWFSCDPNVVKLAQDTDQLFEHFENLNPRELTDQDIMEFRTMGEKKVHELSGAIAASVNRGGLCYHSIWEILW